VLLLLIAALLARRHAVAGRLGARSPCPAYSGLFSLRYQLESSRRADCWLSSRSLFGVSDDRALFSPAPGETAAVPTAISLSVLQPDRMDRPLIVAPEQIMTVDRIHRQEG